MTHAFKSIILAVAVVATGGFLTAQSDEVKARELMEKYKPMLVVLTVEGKVVTTTDGAALPPRDQQRRTLGLTVGRNGLIVVSNSAIDSAVGLSGQKAKLDDKVVTILTARTEFSDVEISYGDATVLKGKVAYRDENADVAFILPDQEQAKTLNKTFESVDLSNFTADAKAADQVVGFTRASSVFGYMPTMVMGRITGVFKEPQTKRIFFVNTAGNSQGTPIFTLDGRLLGITVVRVIDGQPTGVLATLSAGTIEVMANLVK